MSGCAANKLTVIPVVEAFSERATGHKVSNCRSTQRDLTTPWSLRQYWCGAENRKGGLQNTNNDLMDQVAANHSAADQAYIESINNEINQLDYETPIVDSDISIEAIAPSTNQKDAINRLKNIERSDKLKTLPDSKPPTEKVSSNPIRSKATGSIIFAHHLKILGPQGRAATHALIDQVSSSNKVLIRGLVLPDEILVDSKRYREQVSVGRALAVRKYWKEQGIDTAHIIILHYDAGLSGRSVDVTFNG
jgi:hypothetical protein